MRALVGRAHLHLGDEVGDGRLIQYGHVLILSGQAPGGQTRRHYGAIPITGRTEIPTSATAIQPLFSTTAVK
jgi:hypothetical protein